MDNNNIKKDTGTTQIKKGEVFSELSNLIDRQDYLESRLNILSDRLTPVCGQPKTPKTKEVEPKKEIVCQLARQINSIKDKTELLLDTVENILDRLEI